MTTDEALRLVDHDRMEAERIQEENDKIKTELKKSGLQFASLSADVPDPYLITEPMLRLYAEGRRVQAAKAEREYLEWLMQQNQIDLNSDAQDVEKMEQEKIAAIIEKYL